MYTNDRKYDGFYAWLFRESIVKYKIPDDFILYIFYENFKPKSGEFLEQMNKHLMKKISKSFRYLIFIDTECKKKFLHLMKYDKEKKILENTRISIRNKLKIKERQMLDLLTSDYVNKDFKKIRLILKEKINEKKYKVPPVYEVVKDDLKFCSVELNKDLSNKMNEFIKCVFMYLKNKSNISMD